jgi:hypothetical protein
MSWNPSPPPPVVIFNQNDGLHCPNKIELNIIKYNIEQAKLGEKEAP